MSRQYTDLMNLKYHFPFLRWIFFFFLLAVFLPQNSVAQVYYVRAGATGNGTSWTNASGNLRNTLANASDGAQVWVAQGTYFPTNTTNRNLSFEIPSGVAVYGGFVGNETTLSQRNWRQNATILSGDIDNNNDSTANSYNVVYIQNATTSTVLDGFTVSNGFAELPTATGERGNSGANLYLDGKTTSICNPTIRNCAFSRGSAIGYGGGVLCTGSFGGTCNATFTNCVFQNNYSRNEGGAVAVLGYYSGTANPVFERCVFQYNFSTAAGGAVFANAISGTSVAQYRNCRFQHNITSTYGGGIYNLGKSGNCSPNIIGCLFWNNRALSAAGVYCLGSESGQANPNITNCVFYGNTATTGGSVYANAGEAPTTLLPTGTAAPIITNCIIWGNSANTARILRDINGTPNISYSIVDTNSCAGVHSGTGIGASCGSGMLYNRDPLFVNAASGDFHLQRTSPAINAGINSFIASLTTDLDSTPRIKDGTVDIGVYEFDPTTTVTTAITEQPTSQALCEGTSMTMRVGVTSNVAITYQWQRNGVNLTGYTSPTFVLPSLRLTDSGAYRCVIRDIYNQTTTSQAANVSVQARITMSVSVRHNRDSITDGDVIVFTATVTNGSNPQYQWLRNGNIIPSATANILTLTNLQNHEPITCRVTSSETCIVTNPVTSPVDSGVVVRRRPCVSTNETNSFAQLAQAYPNPTNGELFLVLKTLANAPIQLDLIDAQGKICLQMRDIPVTSLTLSLAHLPTGIYFLQLRQNDKVVRTKILKM